MSLSSQFSLGNSIKLARFTEAKKLSNDPEGFVPGDDLGFP
jgi:hypothetical protein